MANKTMKTLTMGGNTYEVMDEYARIEIDTIKESITKEVVDTTLLSANWVGDTAPYTYTVTITGHSNTTDTVELAVGDNMTVDQILGLQSANIVRAEWSDDTNLVLYAYGFKPEIDAPIKIYINHI